MKEMTICEWFKNWNVFLINLWIWYNNDEQKVYEYKWVQEQNKYILDVRILAPISHFSLSSFYSCLREDCNSDVISSVYLELSILSLMLWFSLCVVLTHLCWHWLSSELGMGTHSSLAFSPLNVPLDYRAKF